MRISDWSSDVCSSDLAGGAGDDLHHQCQFLRMLLSRHINHWIFEGQDLADHKALLSYIKLSGNRNQLEAQRRLIDRRLASIASAHPPASDSYAFPLLPNLSARKSVVKGNRGQVWVVLGVD